MAVTYEVVTQVVEVEEVPEKMPESPWHNHNVRQLEDLLNEAVSSMQGAVVFRDIYFKFGDRKYAPDLAVVLQGSPPIEKLGMIYKVPEDGPAPDVIVEVAVSAKALGEALGEKARFYAELGVKDYLVVEAPPNTPLQLWFSKPASGERPKAVTEATLESLGVTFRAEGTTIKAFDKEGKEILPPKLQVLMLREDLRRASEQLAQALEQLAQERAKREELERRVDELERKLQQGDKI
jgi:Protein of unknown function (DUF820).